jgi:hypothetical protein
VDAAAKSAADGYTLLATGPNIINTRHLIRDTPSLKVREGSDKVLANPANRAEFEQKSSVDTIPSSPAQRLAFMQGEERRWAPILEVRTRLTCVT